MIKVDRKKIGISDVINSSDISQFNYCSVAWYLQKIGYEPDSPKLRDGTKKHVRLGSIIDKTEGHVKNSRLLKTLGVLLLFITAIFFIIEVIL